MTDICSTVALRAAWQKFSRGKKARADVQAYQRNLRTNLRELQQELVTGGYSHGRYTPFRICDPKPRQIHKASVRDRLVHQAIVSAIEPLFERRFIYDSYSCRKGKGTHAGVERLRAFLRQVSANNTQRVYVLKCDIRQFFASVDHEILLRCLERHVQDEGIRELLRTVLLSHGAETGRGLPLGNITSQLFANVYLHELDWFMKQELRVSHYARYCDDFVVVARDPGYLRSLIAPIRAFLSEALRLDLHPYKVSIRSWDQGGRFLGVCREASCGVVADKDAPPDARAGECQQHLLVPRPLFARRYLPLAANYQNQSVATRYLSLVATRCHLVAEVCSRTDLEHRYENKGRKA